MRSIEQIEAEIIAAKEGQTSLAGLTSDSRVAIWRLWAYVTAVAIYMHEQLFERFRAEVEEIVAAAPPGTPGWYRNQLLAFQYGDELELVDGVFTYPVNDLSKRIVKRAAIVERPDGVVLGKAARVDALGNLEPLDSDELAALNSYGRKVKFAGTRFAIISLEADVVNLQFDVYYDPIQPLQSVQERVAELIEAYLADLDFNAAFSVTKVTDAIQLASGVVDLQFQSATAAPNGQAAQSFDRRYIPLAGHIEYAADASVMFNWIAV